MSRFASLRWPVYLTALLFVVLPIVDLLVGALPLRPRDIAWRFGFVGMGSRAMLTPLLGLLLAFAAALLLEHRVVQRVLAGVTALAALVLLAVSGVFVFDAVQLRAQVAPAAQTAFQTAAAIALVKYALAVVAMVVFTVVGWRAARPRPEERAARAARGPLLVTQLPESRSQGAL